MNDRENNHKKEELMTEIKVVTHPRLEPYVYNIAVSRAPLNKEEAEVGNEIMISNFIICNPDKEVFDAFLLKLVDLVDESFVICYKG